VKTKGVNMEIRTKKFVPECFGEEYSGFITVKRMSHEDISQVMEDLGMLEMDGKEMSTKENFMWLKKAFDKSKEYLISAEVVRKSDGVVLSLDDLMYETELKNFRSDISKGLMSGWAMGNGNAQQPV
jgi:hypothetical protein